MEDTRLAVCGASDTEMAAIERLYEGAGIEVVYATRADGTRVSAAEAYSVPLPRQAVEVARRGVPVYLVECIDEEAIPEAIRYQVIRIDHHRPGDPGYGWGPANFLAGSSIGQVIRQLAFIGGLPKAWLAVDVPHWESSHEGAFRRYCDRWEIKAGGVYRAIPQELAFVAAADHCLGAAYQGECPGVDPHALMRWRVEQRASLQGRSVDVILNDVAAAREALRQAPRISLMSACCGAHRCAGYVDPQCCSARAYSYVADMRGAGHVPELPEAAVREGLCFLAEIRDHSDRTKVVCQSGSPHQIRLFMSDWATANGVTGVYGDPARGFAGGYVAAE